MAVQERRCPASHNLHAVVDSHRHAKPDLQNIHHVKTRKEPTMPRWRRLRANPRSANIALVLCGIMIASIPLAPFAIGYYLAAAIHEGGQPPALEA
jgi:hypothetical protein